MVENITLTLRKQTASEGCWLWKDPSDETMPRIFKEYVLLGKNEPEWPECTNEEKERYELEWQVAHNPVTEQENQQ